MKTRNENYGLQIRQPFCPYFKRIFRKPYRMVNDAGSPLLLKCCRSCHTWQPADSISFPRERRGSGDFKLKSNCRNCVNAGIV